MTPRDVLVTWLNDAYGMETSLVQVLEHQVDDFAPMPQAQARIQQHLEETKRHAEIVKGCVERLGGNTSSIKKGMSTLMGTVQGMSTSVAQDQQIKDALQDYGAESFEVASYTSLIAAAEEIGEGEVATACRQILQEDQAMANWILQNIPTVTSAMMQKMAGAPA